MTNHVEGLVELFELRGPFDAGVDKNGNKKKDYVFHQYTVNGTKFSQIAQADMKPIAEVGQEVRILFTPKRNGKWVNNNIDKDGLTLLDETSTNENDSPLPDEGLIDTPKPSKSTTLKPTKATTLSSRLKTTESTSSGNAPVLNVQNGARNGMLFNNAVLIALHNAKLHKETVDLSTVEELAKDLASIANRLEG